MKKSTISKIMLLFVMLALAFALCACSLGGGNNNGGGSSGGGSSGGGGSSTGKTTQLKTPVVNVSESGLATWGKVSGAGSFEYVITLDGEETPGTIAASADKSVQLPEGASIKVRAIPESSSKTASEWSEVKSYAMSATKQLINLIRGVEGITTTLNSVEANSTLSADIEIGGFFTATNTNSIALSVKANASATAPEFLIDFKLNDKEYVTLGYKGNKIYVREPLNFVNNSAATKVPEAFTMDVTALDPAVKSLMTWVMTKVADVDIDFTTMADSVSEILDGVGSGVGNLLKVEDGANGTKEIGITVNILKTAMTLLPGLFTEIKLTDMVDEYIGYANKALDALGFDELNLNGEPLSWNTIDAAVKAADKKISKAKADAAELDEAAKKAALANIKESLLKIIVGYDSKKVINKLDLVISLDALQIEGFSYEAGLTIDLNTFAKNSPITIGAPTGFENAAKDLVIDLNGALPLKNLDADVKGVIRLSDAFANKNNKWATVTVTEKNHAGVKSTGYIDATGAYVDFEGIFDILGASKTGLTMSYKANYGKDTSGNPINLVDKINEFAAKLNAPAAAAPRSWDEYEFDLNAIIDGFGAASDKIDYACNYVYNNFVTIIDKTVNEKANATQADLIKWAFEYKLGDTNTAAKDYVLFYNNATSFEALGDNIVACHNNGKAALDAATFAEGKTAGVQLRADGDNNDLLDYLSYFVKIPTISGEDIDWENRVAPSNVAALKAWLNWVFPTTNEYRLMVEDILGKTLTAVIDDGLYLEAIGGEGYYGTVRAAAAAGESAQEYVSLSAGFGLEAKADDNMAAISATALFTDTNEGGEYLIAKTGKAMLDGLRAYYVK